MKSPDAKRGQGVGSNSPSQVAMELFGGWRLHA